MDFRIHVENQTRARDDVSRKQLRLYQLYSRTSGKHIQVLGRRISARGEDGDKYGRCQLPPPSPCASQPSGSHPRSALPRLCNLAPGTASLALPPLLCKLQGQSCLLESLGGSAQRFAGKGRGYPWLPWARPKARSCSPWHCFTSPGFRCSERGEPPGSAFWMLPAVRKSAWCECGCTWAHMGVSTGMCSASLSLYTCEEWCS